MRAASVCTKTTLISGSVGGAGGGHILVGWGHFLLCPLALSMPTYSNFQINGASGETFKVFVAIFTTIKDVIFEKSFSRSSIYLEIAIMQQDVLV